MSKRVVIAFAWDSLSATGTLVAALATVGLATVTYLLVRATYRLASQGQTEVRAQWRPVLLVRSSFPEGHELDYQGNDLYVPYSTTGEGQPFALRRR